MNLLPKVLLNYLSSFLDLESFSNFVVINKKFYCYFSHILILHKMIKSIIPNEKLKVRIKDIINYLKKYKKETLLVQACKNDKITLDLLKSLVENKCDLNSIDKLTLNTPFYNFCRNPNFTVEMLNYLIVNKCDLNLQHPSTHKVPFINACENKNVSLDIIKCLIDNKTNLNFQGDKNKMTPFLFACKTLNFEILRYLGKLFF
jgi:hypothetical protein